MDRTQIVVGEKQMEKNSTCLILFFVLLFLLAPAVKGQEQLQEFALPVARLGEDYRTEIERVLRDKYRLQLQAGRPDAVILWTIGSGEIPAGLSVRTDGTIVGNSKDARAGLYQFSLKAFDMAVRDEPLEIHFSLEVKAGRLRLTKIEAPRLVAVDTAPAADSEFNHPASPALGSKETSATSTETSTNTVPAVKDEKDPAPAPGADVKKMAAANDSSLQNPFSSMNKRFILGVEQSGGASAKSEGKPFLDMFINTPLVYDEEADKLPRVSVWGDVRLTSTPSQIKAFANISNAAIDSITGGNVNDLALGFDFLVGPEVRVARFDNTTLAFIGAFGAVSPLSPKQSVEIFDVPKENSSQADAFFKEFPGAKGKEHIAFVAPERDRFLRQYYGGLRFRTYTKDSGTIQDVFPSMLDVTFGQSEAVTGGRLHKFVFGLDGFYVLPFPAQYRFLYLFGSAKFKVGGPKSINTPFLLDTSASSVQVTDPSVFIADPKPSNRDVYRIGFGVDLFELFRKN
jgi:hypothetical protein